MTIPTSMTIYDKLTQLGITLPVSAPPVAAFAPFVQTGGGSLIFISGHIARKSGKVWTGKLGIERTTEEGWQAARAVAIELIGALHSATGDLSRVTRIVKLTVLVNSSPEFTAQHVVANGASELFLEIFGEAGAHARAAFGVAQIPFGSCVEIDLVAEVQSPKRNN